MEERNVGFIDAFITKGYAIAGGTLNVMATNNDDVKSAETAYKVKERFIEEFGAPIYTVATGVSGGSIQQHMIANAYPGILDGILPGRSYADTMTFLRPLYDCELLINLFKKAGTWNREQMDAISGNPDDPFHHVKARLSGRKKNHDILALYFPVGKQRPHPVGGRSEQDPVYEDMVADQQCVLHGTGGDFKGLQDEGDDEQSGHQHRGQRGQELHGSLARLFFRLVFFFRYLLRHWTFLARRLYLRPIEPLETCGPTGSFGTNGSRRTRSE